MTGPHWKLFDAFLDSKADRFQVLLKALASCDMLEKRAPQIVTLAGCRHIFISAEKQTRRPVTLIAHYDRVKGSPGANDNGAAVFLLIETALRLRERGASNYLIVFTDKEEVEAGQGLMAQGAYTLAKALSATFLREAPFFIFDACGRGDTLVISTTAASFSQSGSGAKAAKQAQNLLRLRESALSAAKRAYGSRVSLLPTPFSDDAGFLLAGLPAQTLTVLPSCEERAFSQIARLRKYPASLVTAEYIPTAAPCAASRAASRVPQTWSLLNSGEDTQASLTPRFFSALTRFAEELVHERHEY